MATEPSTREAKLIQYLNEAYGKEKELETALKAHISMTSRDAYKKRLREHLKETQQQAKGLERRIKQLGGKAEAIDLPGPDVASGAATAAVSAANKAVSLAKGPLHMIRGTGEAEKLLKNAKTELWNEFEEIGNYIAIEQLATALYDRDTAQLAKEFRRQEERMAAFLQKLIPQLAKQVVRDEVPARDRRPADSSASPATATRRRSTTTTASGAASAAKPAARRTTAAKPAAARRASSNGSAPRAASSRAKTAASPARPKAANGTSGARPTNSRASTSRAKKS
jgi:ferritin-like metal-binding protein YciE